MLVVFSAAASRLLWAPALLPATICEPEVIRVGEEERRAMRQRLAEGDERARAEVEAARVRAADEVAAVRRRYRRLRSERLTKGVSIEDLELLDAELDLMRSRL